jgi:hypothetical protein
MADLIYFTRVKKLSVKNNILVRRKSGTYFAQQYARAGLPPLRNPLWIKNRQVLRFTDI